MSDLNPKVTVCIPVYNRATYVGDAIESVLSQDFSDFELLLIDDGSTDDSVATMERYADRRIRLVSNDGNRGIPYSRNRGVELARGTYLAWLDSDDLMAPRRLSRQVEFLDRHPEVAILGGWLRRFDNTGRHVGTQIKPLVHEQLRVALLFRTSHATTTLMARTSVLREFGHALDFPVAEDHDLLERLSGRFRFANLPTILSCQREHGGRVTKSAKDKLLHAKYRLIDRQLRRLGINASQDDLTRHYLLTRIKAADCNADPDYLEWAAGWLEDLVEANRRSRVYSEKAMAGSVAQVWLKTCRKAVGPLGLAKTLYAIGRVRWLLPVASYATDNLISAARLNTDAGRRQWMLQR